MNDNCTCADDYICPPCRKEDADYWAALHAENIATPPSTDARNEHDPSL